MNTASSLSQGFLLLSLAVAATAPMVARADIIDSTYGVGAGSFELGAFVNNGCSVCIDYMRVASGSTTITGWTVGGPGNGVDWLIEPTFNAANGVHAIDLTSITQGSISTVIPTTSGVMYNVTFQGASVQGSTTTGLLTAGSLSQGFAPPPSASTASQSFAAFSYFFMASSANTTVRFSVVGTQAAGTSYGPVIDSVAITAVPEPNSAVLLLSGVGLLLAVSAAQRTRT